MTFFVVLYSYACWFNSIVYLLGFQFIWASNQYGLKLVTNLHMSRKSRGQHEDLCRLVFLWHSLKLCILMTFFVVLYSYMDFWWFDSPVLFAWISVPLGIQNKMVSTSWQISIWVDCNKINQEDAMKTITFLQYQQRLWSLNFHMVCDRPNIIARWGNLSKHFNSELTIDLLKLET